MNANEDELDVEATSPEWWNRPVRLDLVFSGYHYVYAYNFIFNVGHAAISLGWDQHLPMKRSGLDTGRRAALLEIGEGFLEQMAELTPPEDGARMSQGGKANYHGTAEEYHDAIDVVLEELDREDDP